MSGLELIPEGDERRGWFKLVIPDVNIIFGPLLNPKGGIRLMGFIYGKIDPEQAAFDVSLTVPYIAVDRVLLAQEVRGQDGGVKVGGVPLKVLAHEHENRCYVPTQLVTCVIPLDPHDPAVELFVRATDESLVKLPTADEVKKIVDMTGKKHTPGGGSSKVN
jgi:hypothetical protein